ncbi:hypothetical protein OIDMADRAFT_16040 [Oidiodendron maius Zn]|uniref:Uncharacterized protein n=1 Tax=Oidiodendron maius (strain Zn) TaxID=913774 RepID=A0A0C3HWD4_OIDMZ|nr:hypothetical protein OIDMADRAFT_16040 [Oidiodendron maius Zn]
MSALSALISERPAMDTVSTSNRLKALRRPRIAQPLVDICNLDHPLWHLPVAIFCSVQLKLKLACSLLSSPLPKVRVGLLGVGAKPEPEGREAFSPGSFSLHAIHGAKETSYHLVHALGRTF